MADTQVLGTCALRRVGSSPTFRTQVSHTYLTYSLLKSLRYQFLQIKRCTGIQYGIRRITGRIGKSASPKVRIAIKVMMIVSALSEDLNGSI